MLLLIDIFSINRSRGYENPSLDIIVIELYSTGGFPLEEAREHCFLNQSAISVVILISFQCYCGDCSGYIVVILPFLAFYFCSAYLLYMVYYIGPTKTKGLKGEKYFMLLVDDYTRMTAVCFLKNKSRAFENFKIYKEMVENEMDSKIKCLRYDNGGDFTSKELMDYCNNHGIKRQFSVARTPQQNGVVEKKNRTIQEMDRTMLMDSKLTDIFWTQAVHTHGQRSTCWLLKYKEIIQVLQSKIK
jgi:hypothetical protein